MNSTKSAARAAGFTLIELLVVIAKSRFSQLFSSPSSLPPGAAQRVTLAFVDWDDLGRRAEQITVKDLNSGRIVDQRDVSDSRPGKYLSYNLSGNVRILLKSNNWTTAALSGLFFDSADGATSFIGEDDATQGDWGGKYGAEGYDIAGADAKLPPNASVEPALRMRRDVDERKHDLPAAIPVDAQTRRALHRKQAPCVIANRTDIVKGDFDERIPVVDPDLLYYGEWYWHE